MYPNSNNLHGDHYGFGQVNINPNSSLTNAPKGQSISGLPKQNNGLNIEGLGSSGIASSSSNNSNIVMPNSNTINDHNEFLKASTMAVSKENVVIPKESGNVKLVLIIGIILFLLIVVALLCLVFIK